MPQPTTSTAEQDKHQKLKRSIIVGVLLIIGIVAWHFYEYFLQDKKAHDDETPHVHEIIDLTQHLYADELKHNPYLAHVHFQGKIKPYNRDDQAPAPLLELHYELMSADTTSTVYYLKRLYDNYELNTHVVEVVTAEEEQEELDFLHAVLKTPIMKRTMKFLQQKGAVAANLDAQLQLLKDIWFTQYSRGNGRVSSSGFEHVFLAELKDHSILGLHNWLYFSAQEREGQLDYKGFIDRLDLGKDNQHLISLRFTFHNVVKPYNSLFIGTSPELEMSLYTVCFVLSPGEPCPIELGRAKFDIITHVWDWHGKKTIATAYPSIEK